MTLPTRSFKARWILPISQPPICGGWIRTRGRRVVEIQQGKAPSDAVDLGDVAILPGLVNAHTHLEFSDLASPIGHPGIALHDWIGQVVAARHTARECSAEQAICSGVDQSIAAGVQLLGEITTPPCDYSFHSNALQITAFGEVLGLSAERGEQRIAEAENFLQVSSPGLQTAVSPHSPYSTPPALIDRSVALAIRYRRAVAMHVAESPLERELLCTGKGDFAESLKRLGVWQDNVFPWADASYSTLLDQLCRATRTLLIHGNDLQRSERERLTRYPGATVVYCPRTHAFFGYEPHPVAEMLAIGIRVALGTDSRASNPDLDLWGEVQYLLRHRSDIDPEQVLRMATLSGAEALGRNDLGHLQVGSRSALLCIATAAANPAQLYDDLSQQPLKSERM